MRLVSAFLLFTLTPLALTQEKRPNPRIADAVSQVSEEHIGEILKKLEGFGTRNIFSTDDDSSHGIGAARRWIYDQFRAYSPRLEVSFDTYRVKKKGRIVRDVEVHNVVAVLPGTMNKDHNIIVSGHYDSAVLRRRPENAPTNGAAPATGSTGTTSEAPAADSAQSTAAGAFDIESVAPGANDDGSGTAAVMELARVMSKYEWRNTIVFIAFTGEEEGLVGSTLYARKAHKENKIIDAVLNNDIIGDDTGGDGRKNNTSVAVYSEEPADSSSRELARFVKQACELYVPSMRVDLVFRQDRLGRGGDHAPFNQEGYAAIRFTTPEENYKNQHTVTDTVANMSIPYNTQVARENAATLASLALAPKKPQVEEEVTRQGRKSIVTMLTRGKSRYDAQLRWKNPNPEPDLAGYIIVMRNTTSPYWEKEIFVGNVTEYTLKDVSIDDRIFGVKAVDKDGNMSLVSAYIPRPRQPLEIETY